MIGLRNLANTCFVSSVLQCIYHTPTFIGALEKCRDKDHGKSLIIRVLIASPEHGNARACLLCDLLNIRLKSESKRSFSPTDICSHLNRMLI